MTAAKAAPYVIVSEYRLLNTIIKSPIYLKDSRLHEGVFPHAIAQTIYRAINYLHELGIGITPNSLFQKANELDYNVTLEVINQIFSIEPTPGKTSDIEEALKVLHKAKQKQNLQEQIDSLQYLIGAGELDSSAVSAKLYEAGKIIENEFDTQILKNFDAWFEVYLEDLKTRAFKKRYPYGDVLLDELVFKGAYPGAITVIAGATGQGKSAYVLNLVNGMVNLGIPCMYISLEMSDIDTMDRFISLRKKIPSKDLYIPGDGLDTIIKVVEQERAKLMAEGGPFYFVDKPDLSIGDVLSLIKEFKQRTHRDYLIVAIDLVTQLKEFTKTSAGMNLASAIEMAMNQLNAIAKSENVHFILVSQFGRDADKIKVTEMSDLDLLRPSLNDIKNSNAIAERARVVLGIFRAKYYADRYLQDDEQAAYLEDIMEVNILKQSNGPVGRIKYLYEGDIFNVVPILTDGSDEKSEEIKQAESKIGSF